MNLYGQGIILTFVITVSYGKAPSRGWNDNIDWMNFEDALAKSENTNIPIMLLIHKSWCGACKQLKVKFAESSEIEELSKYFLMVNVMDDEEPKGDKYSPDGAYIPRILFIREGQILSDLYHVGGNEMYRYYYHSPDGIVKTMKRAIENMTLKVHSDEQQGRDEF